MTMLLEFHEQVQRSNKDFPGTIAFGASGAIDISMKGSYWLELVKNADRNMI
jgi:hypothetical protein